MPQMSEIWTHREECRTEQPVICKRCSEPGHTVSECEADLPKCVHCEDSHTAGARNSPRQIRECELLRIQSTHKTSFRRAIQIENGDEVVDVPYEKLPDIFTIKMLAEQKKNLKPWDIERFFKDLLDENPSELRSISDSAYLIKVTSQPQKHKIMQLKNILNTPVTILTGSALRPRGLIYITEYDLSSFESFKLKLMETLPVSEIVQATWIKSRNNRSFPLLLTFNRSEIPTYLSIPGEQALTKVYAYKNKPLLCQKCLAYGHSGSRCVQNVRCARCNSEGHQRDECDGEDVQCYHCNETHITGSKLCPRYKLEEEILAIQQKKCISRNQARLFLENNNPKLITMNFKNAILNSTKKPKLQDNESTSPIPPVIQPNKSKNFAMKQSRPNSNVANTHSVQAFLQSPTTGRINI